MTAPTRTVHATVTVSVSINAPGSLAEGAASVLERVDVVERVDEPRVCGLSPGLNDTTVDCRARLSIAVGDRGEDVALVRRALESAVCVEAVRSLEPAEAAEGDPPLEDPAPITARPSVR